MQGAFVRHRARLACSLALALLVVGVFSAAVFAVPPTLSTDPASPDGANGWFVTLPTVTIGPPLPGSYILYKWQPNPSWPINIYTSPLKFDSTTYGQPTMRYGYGVNPGVFDEWAERTFKIDPVPPTVTNITAQTPLPQNPWTRSTEVTFSVQTYDIHSLIYGFSYVCELDQPAVDSVWDSRSSLISVKNLYTGKWYFRVRPVDTAGNWGTVTPREHWVDITPPIATPSVAAEYEGTATVTVAALDQHSGLAAIESNLDGEPYENASWQTTTAPGTHVLRYRASDTVGNVSAEASRTFEVVANQPPTTTIAGVFSGWLPSQEFTLSAIDNSSGVAHVYYRVDGGLPVEYVSKVTLTGNGARNVEYWSVDNAGNVETPKSMTVRVDAQKPVINIGYLSPVEGTSTVTFSASDALSGLTGPPQVFVDTVAWLAGSPVTITAAGVHEVMVVASDAAGNSTTSFAYVTVLPYSPPVSTIAGLDGAWVQSETFTLSAVDNYGVGAIYYRLNGGAEAEYFTPVTISDEGTTAITYWAVDSLGSAETTKGPAFAYVDHSPPLTTAGTWAPRAGSTSFALAASDTYSPVDHIWYRLDGGATTTYTTPATVSVRGLHKLEYGAVDAAGNAELPKTLWFSVARIPTSFSARVSSAKVVSGRSVVISGAVRNVYAPVRGSSNVYLWSSVMGGTWTKVGKATYDWTSATYRVTRPITANQRFQLRFAGDVDNAPCNSAILSVGCQVSISAPVTPWFNSVGRYVVVYGTLYPAHTTGSTVATLYCYRYEGGQWVLRKTVPAKGYYASRGTKYGAFVTLPLRGTWRIVAAHSDARHTWTASPPRTLLVQ